MQILTSLMYVVLPTIGVVIGAALQYWFTKVLEERRHMRNLKTQAYLDFYHNFMDAFFKGETEETRSHLADAIARIAVYGNKESIESVANIKRVSAKRREISESEFESKFGYEFRHSFIAIVQSMRKDGLPKENVSDEKISWLLFGKGL